MQVQARDGVPVTTVSGTAPSVTYGPWERDPDVTPVLRLSATDPSVTILQHSYRRKRFEIWRDQSGRKMGCWDWERSA